MHAGIRDLQWILDGYLVTLSALLLLGGSLGDLYGRKRGFLTGLVGFSVASAVCGFAPNAGVLIAARAVQGAGAALLVPGSLALISASFHPDDRGRAIGAWSGLAGVAGAIGPFVGGWLIDAVSWRLIFFINVPLAAACFVITWRHVPESLDEDDRGVRPDVPGAVTASLGLAAMAYGLIEGRWSVGIVGALIMVAFVLIERRVKHPMLPLSIFRSSQFTGANLTTLAVYTGLGGTTFALVLQLQKSLGYSALESGLALFPLTIMMLLFSSRAGALAQRIGPRAADDRRAARRGARAPAPRARPAGTQLRGGRASRSARLRIRPRDHRRTADDGRSRRGRRPASRCRLRVQQRGRARRRAARGRGAAADRGPRHRVAGRRVRPRVPPVDVHLRGDLRGSAGSSRG